MSVRLSSQSSLQSELFDAVIGNNTTGVESLLISFKPFIDLNGWNSVCKTPLCIAIDNGNEDMVQLLLENGANIDAVSYSQMTCAYESPITIVARLHNAKLIELILKYVLSIGEDEDSGKTALHWAATHGNITLAKTLVQRGADINRLGPCGNTALHYSTIADMNDMVTWLLLNGAFVTLNDEGRSAMHIAASRGNVDLVCCLLEAGCTTVSRDNFNFSPLALACLRSHGKVVEQLVKSGLDVDLNDGLRRAAESGAIDVVKYLLTCQCCNIDGISDWGESALIVAAARGQYEAVKLLLDSEARMDTVDVHGYTSLTAALMREHADIVTVLIVHGSPTSPAAVASSQQHPLKMPFVLANPVLVKYLFLVGCSLHDCDLEGFLCSCLVDAMSTSEMKFSCSARMHFKWDAQVVKETCKWLEIHLCSPKSLKQQCRIVIREQLLLACAGCSILGRISELPLPVAVRCYLRFDDILVE